MLTKLFYNSDIMKKIKIFLKLLLLFNMMIVVTHDYVIDQQELGECCVTTQSTKVLKQHFSSHHTESEHSAFHLPLLAFDGMNTPVLGMNAKERFYLETFSFQETSYSLFNPPKLS